MNEIRFIRASFDSLDNYLKGITTKINSNSWEEKELPKVEDCEEILEKISKLDERCLTTIRNSYAASPSIVRYCQEYSDDKVPELQKACKIVLNWTLNQEINALEQRAMPYFLAANNQGSAQQLENRQRELLALSKRIRVLCKQQNITSTQLERLNLLVQDLVKTSNDLVSSIKNMPEKDAAVAQTFNLLESLPQEILGRVCELLPVEDLLRLGQCNKALNESIQDQNYWRFYFQCSNTAVSIKTGESAKQKFIELKRSERLERNVKNGFHISPIFIFPGYAARINGDYLVCATDCETVEIRDLKKRAVVLVSCGAVQRRLLVNTLHGSHSFIIKDDLLYSAAWNQIEVTDLKTKQSIATFTEHKKSITDLQIEGNFLYSASMDKTIKVWDLKTRKCVKVLKGHTNAIFSFRILDNFLYSVSESVTLRGLKSTLKCWTLDTGQCVATKAVREVMNNNATIRCLDAVDDLLYLGFTFGEIQVWNRTSMKYIQAINAYTETSCVSCVKVIGSFLFSGSTDFSKNKRHIIKIWDRKTMQIIRKLEKIEHEKQGIQRLDMRDNILYVSLGDTVRIWDFSLSDMQFLATLPEDFKSTVSKLPDQMQLELSEELYFHMPARLNLSINTLNDVEKLIIYRYFLKQVVNALKIGKTAKAAHIFSLISGSVRDGIIEKSKETSAIDAIQNFLKETEQKFPSDILWQRYVPKSHQM